VARDPRAPGSDARVHRRGRRLGRVGRAAPRPLAQRIAVARPEPARDGWSCAVEVGGRTDGPRAIAGRGPVDALVGALRVAALATGEWSGLPHLSPGYVRPPRTERAHVRGRRPAAVLRHPIAVDGWRLDGSVVAVAQGDLARRSVDPLPHGTWACRLRVGDGPHRDQLGVGALHALKHAAWRASSVLWGFAMAHRAGAPGSLHEPQEALTRALWRGIDPLGDETALREVAVAAVVHPVVRRGEVQHPRFAVGVPSERAGGWTCGVDLAGLTAGPVAVWGDGPVRALVSAMRLVHVALEDWSAAPFEADEPPDLEAPFVSGGNGPLATEVLRVVGAEGARDHRIVVDWPRLDPEHEGTWICGVRVGGWLDGEVPAYGVSPVDALRNAARLVAGFVQLHEQVGRDPR
jgi:hypothetical protein